jgi:hypothetical protein
MVWPTKLLWGRNLQTAGDLVSLIMTTEYGGLVRAKKRFSPEEVWSILQTIVANCLEVPRDRVSKETRWKEDLNAG